MKTLEMYDVQYLNNDEMLVIDGGDGGASAAIAAACLLAYEAGAYLARLLDL